MVADMWSDKPSVVGEKEEILSFFLLVDWPPVFVINRSIHTKTEGLGFAGQLVRVQAYGVPT